MKIPYLKKKSEIKSCHNVEWVDNYSWIHQKNILEVLRDKSKLDPEVKKYLEEENDYADFHLKDTRKLQKMSLYLTKIITTNIGQKLQPKEIIQLNSEKKLEQVGLRKFGMEIRKKNNLKLNILVLVI